MKARLAHTKHGETMLCHSYTSHSESSMYIQIERKRHPEPLIRRCKTAYGVHYQRHPVVGVASIELPAGLHLESSHSLNPCILRVSRPVRIVVVGTFH